MSDEGALGDRDDGAVQNRHQASQPAHQDGTQQLGVELVGIVTTAHSPMSGGTDGHRDVRNL